jgi:hypothetical protein
VLSKALVCLSVFPGCPPWECQRDQAGCAQMPGMRRSFPHSVNPRKVILTANPGYPGNEWLLFNVSQKVSPLNLQQHH